MDDSQARPDSGDQSPDNLEPRKLEVAEEAARAASEALTADPNLDVEARLRLELSRRGLSTANDAWVRDLGEEIRAGHPGSMGGDNGGGWTSWG